MRMPQHQPAVSARSPVPSPTTLGPMLTAAGAARAEARRGPHTRDTLATAVPSDQARARRSTFAITW
jgi:hypothetical protein